MADTPRGEVVGRGRAADVYAAGAGLVLRRYRTDHDSAPEAAVMAHLHVHGFPVPAVAWAEGRDLVMQRLEGPTMLDDIGRRPWRTPAHGRTLAGLHRQLAELPPPPAGAAEQGEGDAVVHGDLHPGNVVLTPVGPVVIDWSNARCGHRLDDVAQTWLLLATSDLPGGRVGRLLAGLACRVFLRSFLAGFDRAAVARRLPSLAARRCADPNVTDDERRRIHRFVDRLPVVRPASRWS
jgi:aminoglycoside phosphotransferase (APT) family kinase protein